MLIFVELKKLRVVSKLYIPFKIWIGMVSKRSFRMWNAWVAVFFWILVGSTFFYFTEHWTLIDCFYFSISTLTTVGYGDLVPQSQLGRLFAGFYILFGVGTVLASLGIFGREFLYQEEIKFKQRYSRHQIKSDKEVTSEIEKVKKILKKNTKELKEQSEILEHAELVEEIVPVKKTVLKKKEIGKKKVSKSKK